MEYLNKMLIYLKQELEDNNHEVSIVNDRIVFLIDENESFNDHYNKLQDEISSSINRLRSKENPLNFNIKTSV